MKKFYFLLMVLCLFTSAKAQIISFPDPNFKTKLLAAAPNNAIAKNLSYNYFKIDANSDGEIDVSEASQVSYLDVSISSINSLEGISNLNNLKYLYCRNNQITALDLSSLTNLLVLECNVNQITTLDVSMSLNLQKLICSENQLTSLNVTGLSNLSDLRCYINHLTTLDITSLSSLQYLDCKQNNISSLDASNLTNLTELTCNYNSMSTLNLNGSINLRYLDCSYNFLSSLTTSGLIKMIVLNCKHNQITSIDLNGMGLLQNLDCGANQLTALDLTGLTNLIILFCNDNQLTSLDVNGLTNIIQLDFSSNNKPLLDVSTLSTNLRSLRCGGNQYTSIDVSNLTGLTSLDCSNNQLTSINVNNLTNLTGLSCNYNQLTSLDVSNLVNLTFLGCDNNPIQTLDLSSLPNFKNLYCQNNNQLKTLFIKNGSLETALHFVNSTNLQYICADENQITNVQSKIDSYGYTNTCHVNSYCTFVPTGTFYTVQGNNKYDNDNNGCDTSDINVPNLKLSYSNGTTTGGLICDTTGSYFYDVQAGSHTIIPSIENPSYFNISPAITTVVFPTQASPFTQDFCVSANGVHPDLEIMILPIDVARPGFDADYMIIYKNKGTFTQSGTVNLEFDDAVLDFVSADPSTTAQTTNNLSWDYTNLLPFETREIYFSMNLNSPTETPALNSGDILDYTVNIISPAIDDTPNDNTAAFYQAVVNSFDPNDKTCLEGTTITPAMVGEYVHYVIRFENTGTFPAQNIVVKDMIDLAKFDINTLIPIKGSHDFVTKISDTNKVEFIFENINLPFDDANNDGFVAFKIKTKSSLVVGDTFDNSANIYFDYNFPIVTNTASTTVQTLGTSDFEFANYFSLYPNPASTMLNLSVKNGIEVASINIYNTLGQLVIAIPNAQSVSNIDVSSLRTGNYFIKMTTDKGTSNTKFIKN